MLNNSQLPSQYFELTTAEEQALYAAGLQNTSEPVQTFNSQHGPVLAIFSIDWNEPGLLDLIFDILLRSSHIVGEINISHARIFTTDDNQVINLIELADANQQPISTATCTKIAQYLKEQLYSKRHSLDIIEDVHLKNFLIPQLGDLPKIDTEQQFGILTFQTNRLSIRFVSVLLYILAHSSLCMNVRIAHFYQQDNNGIYKLWLLDKLNRPIRWHNFVLHELSNALSELQKLIMNFNIRYLSQRWMETSTSTFYLSRPRPQTLLQQLDILCELNAVQGHTNSLSGLLERKVLSDKDFYKLEGVKAFIKDHIKQLERLKDNTPNAADTLLCRDYFQQAQAVAPIIEDAHQQLMHHQPQGLFNDQARLAFIAHPLSIDGGALNKHCRLYWPHNLLDSQGLEVFNIYRLIAKTGYLPDLQTETMLRIYSERITDEYRLNHAESIAKLFMQIIDEANRQSTTAFVLRAMRSSGLLGRILPGFSKIEGLIHVVDYHSYTVDEHSFVLIEALNGLQVFSLMMGNASAEVFDTEYKKIKNAVELKRFAHKFRLEFNMMTKIVQLNRNAQITPFLKHIADIRLDSSEMLEDLNILQRGETMCFTALNEIINMQRLLKPFINLYHHTSADEKKVLALAGLLHDFKKPSAEHPQLMADALKQWLKNAGWQLNDQDEELLRWLILHHLDIKKLIAEVGAHGEQALIDFIAEHRSQRYLCLLILFTYADRLAMSEENSRHKNNLILLSDLLRQAEALHD